MFMFFVSMFGCQIYPMKEVIFPIYEDQSKTAEIFRNIINKNVCFKVYLGRKYEYYCKYILYR